MESKKYEQNSEDNVNCIIESKTQESHSANYLDVHLQGNHHQIDLKCIQFIEIRDSPVKAEQSEQIMLQNITELQDFPVEEERSGEVNFECTKFISQNKMQEILVADRSNGHL